MPEDDRGWDKLVEFMFSGSAGSFALWALLVYGLWAALFTDWRKNGADAGWSGDSDGGCD